MDPVDRTVLLARAALSPSGADDERARRALGLGPNALAASPSAARPGARVWTALRASGGAGVAIAALLVGLGFAGGFWVGHRESPVAALAPAASSVAAPEPQATLEAAAVPAPRDAEDHAALAGRSERASEARTAFPAPPRAVGSAPRAHLALGSSKAAARAARPDAAAGAPRLDPGEELALLRRIERSLRSGEAALALALLGELTERFPETRLDEERAAASVLVHCALRDPGARQRAEAFLSERAASVYTDRVRSSCSIEGATASGRQ